MNPAKLGVAIMYNSLNSDKFFDNFFSKFIAAACPYRSSRFPAVIILPLSPMLGNLQVNCVTTPERFELTFLNIHSPSTTIQLIASKSIVTKSFLFLHLEISPDDRNVGCISLRSPISLISSRHCLSAFGLHMISGRGSLLIINIQANAILVFPRPICHQIIPRSSLLAAFHAALYCFVDNFGSIIFLNNSLSISAPSCELYILILEVFVSLVSNKPY